MESAPAALLPLCTALAFWYLAPAGPRSWRCHRSGVAFWVIVLLTLVLKCQRQLTAVAIQLQALQKLWIVRVKLRGEEDGLEDVADLLLCPPNAGCASWAPGLAVHHAVSRRLPSVSLPALPEKLDKAVLVRLRQAPPTQRGSVCLEARKPNLPAVRAPLT